MTKVTVFSGFLGAGKTTLIKKLIGEAWQGEKLVLIENEFGEIGIDGGFLKDAGVNITEMNSGCICCSLVGDFGKALQKVTEEYHPDRIIIEPSGVGKLSDVVGAVHKAGDEFVISGCVAVVDGVKAKMYAKNFGEFYNNQIEAAGTIVLSRSQSLNAEKLTAVETLLRERNATAPIVTTPWEELDAATLMEAIEPKKTLEELLLEQHAAEAHAHHHEHGEECHCHEDEHAHHHEHGEECHCHEDEHAHHHEHGEECHCHEGEHEENGHLYNEKGEELCPCGCGHVIGKHSHHADEVFTSWGHESARAYSEEELQTILIQLDTGNYGMVLRAKGIVPCTDGSWLHFDYVPAEHDIRHGGADYTGRLCVIGAKLDEAALGELFGA